MANMEPTPEERRGHVTHHTRDDVDMTDSQLLQYDLDDLMRPPDSAELHGELDSGTQMQAEVAEALQSSFQPCSDTAGSG